MKKTPTLSLVHEEIKHQTNQSAGYINAKPCTPRSSLVVGKEDVSRYVCMRKVTWYTQG
jgi:hypothetical protein